MQVSNNSISSFPKLRKSWRETMATREYFMEITSLARKLPLNGKLSLVKASVEKDLILDFLIELKKMLKSLTSTKDFNIFFNSIKKSKIKSFSTDAFTKLNLPFNGSFLAKEVISMKYSLVAIVSRHDFLSFGKEEIELFETCIDLLQPHFERLIDREFSDKRISELRICLKDFPLPLRVKDSITGASFLNDLFNQDLQDQDIFFNKKVHGPFQLDLYDCDELRHYAFDLFHFQRISLLGELLNTLRHELSNPLFGLKLSSQIFV